jgi:hypothetical protein
MLSGKQLLEKLPRYNGSIGILKYDQTTDDIITNMLNVHNEYKKDYDKIFPYFIGTDLYQTCFNIYDFLKRNVIYKIEPSEKQTLKSPSAIIAQGYGDCKQYSQFIGGILDAISRNKNNINWCYRFASYNDEKQLQHVFVVAKDKTGKEIWIDPVLNTFDKKKKYTYKEDKKPMALYKISGFTNVSKARAAQKSFKNMTPEERSAYVNAKIQSGEISLPVLEPQPTQPQPNFGLPETILPVLNQPVTEPVAQQTTNTSTFNLKKYILPIGILAAILILNKK